MKANKKLPVWFRLSAFGNDDVLGEEAPIAIKTCASLIGGSHFMDDGKWNLCFVEAVQNDVTVTGAGLNFPKYGTVELPSYMYYNHKTRDFQPV